MTHPPISPPPSVQAKMCAIQEQAEPVETLRDRFAMAALTGILSQRMTQMNNLGYVLPSEKEPICTAAYHFADAMLKVRLY